MSFTTVNFTTHANEGQGRGGDGNGPKVAIWCALTSRDHSRPFQCSLRPVQRQMRVILESRQTVLRAAARWPTSWLARAKRRARRLWAMPRRVCSSATSPAGCGTLPPEGPVAKAVQCLRRLRQDVAPTTEPRHETAGQPRACSEMMRRIVRRHWPECRPFAPSLPDFRNVLNLVASAGTSSDGTAVVTGRAQGRNVTRQVEPRIQAPQIGNSHLACHLRALRILPTNRRKYRPDSAVRLDLLVCHLRHHPT